MPRTAQAAEAAQEENVLAGEVTVDGLVSETTEPVPAEFDPAKIQEMVTIGVARELIPMLQALLPEMLKSIQPAQHNGPTGVTHVDMIQSEPAKPNFLKHYRMDGTISGKYQLIDVSKLDENGEIPYDFAMGPDGRWRGDSPAVVKGKWIHFANDHFYATTPMEVAYIEWRIKTDPTFRAYEDKNMGGDAVCVVANCGKAFADQDTLNAHLAATHGVGRTYA